MKTKFDKKFLTLLTVLLFILPYLNAQERKITYSEDVKRLFEKFWDSETVKRVQKDPKFYNEYLSEISESTSFPRAMLPGICGYHTVGRWGSFFIKQFSEEAFNEVILWRNHEEDRLRYTVWSIIGAYVENKTTPDEVVKNKIKPLLLEKKRNPDSAKWIQNEIDSVILAEQVRFMDKNKAFNLLSSKILNEKEVNKFYPMKLLSLLATKEAVDFIEKNLNRVGNDIYFLEIAKMNYELSSCEEPFEIYKKYFTDEKCHFATRIYALWHLFKCDNIKRLEVVYNVYKSEKKDLDLYNAGKDTALSEQEKYGKGELWEAIKSVLDRFEQDSSLHDEIKRLSWPK